MLKGPGITPFKAQPTKEQRMGIQPEETLIAGSWKMENGQMVSDSEERRIDHLVTNELERIATSASGWEVLYRDPADGRYWEMFSPRGEMHGGGPRSLRALDPKSIQDKFGISINK
jgi:hypothetical protein